MMTKARLHVIPLALALILFMVALNGVEQVMRWMDRSVPAIEWQGVEVLTQTVRPGGELSVIYTARINKSCPADLRGFLIAPDGSAPVRFPVVAGGYAKPSDDPVMIRVSITIPRQADRGLHQFQNGNHIYRTMATRYCPEGVEEDASVPDVPFMLEVVE